MVPGKPCLTRLAHEGQHDVSQYVPEAGHEDVERILKRDSPVESQDGPRQLIEVVEVRERDGVVLACTDEPVPREP